MERDPDARNYYCRSAKTANAISSTVSIDSHGNFSFIGSFPFFFFVAKKSIFDWFFSLFFLFKWSMNPFHFFFMALYTLARNPFVRLYIVACAFLLWPSALEISPKRNSAREERQMPLYGYTHTQDEMTASTRGLQLRLLGDPPFRYRRQEETFALVQSVYVHDNKMRWVWQR